MKNFTKRLALLLAFVMVVGLCVPTTVAYARDAETGTITIDFSNESFTVSGVTDFEYTQFVPKSGTAAPTADEKKNIKDANWVPNNTDDFNDVSGIGWDISWFNKKKDSYLVVRVASGSAYDYYVSEIIKAATPALKVGFATVASGSSVGKTDKKVPDGMTAGQDATGYLYFYKEPTKGAVEFITPSAVSYRKDGTYTIKNVASDLPDELKVLKAKGGLLFFSAKTANSGAGKADGWIVNETKYKCAAQKGAPNLKVNVNHTIALSDKMEYRIVNGSTKSDWVKAIDQHKGSDNKITKNIRIEDLVCTGAAESIIFTDKTAGKFNGDAKIQVRLAGTATSMPSRYKTITVSQTSIAASDVTVSNASTSAAVNIAYVKPFDEKGGVVITNRDKDNAYEFCCLASGTSVTGATKWTALKAASTKDTAVTLKYSDTKPTYGKDYTVYVRKAGDPKNKELTVMASGYVTKVIGTDLVKVTQAINGTAAVVKPDSKNITIVATTGSVTVTVPVESVSGESITGAEVTFNVTNFQSAKDTVFKWTSGKDTKPFKVSAPVYDGSGKLKVTFDIDKTEGAEKDSPEYKCTAEGIEFTFKIQVKKTN